MNYDLFIWVGLVELLVYMIGSQLARNFWRVVLIGHKEILNPISFNKDHNWSQIPIHLEGKTFWLEENTTNNLFTMSNREITEFWQWADLEALVKVCPSFIWALAHSKKNRKTNLR